MGDEVRKEHESYGVLTVHRATGTFDNLFQSSVASMSGMILKVCRAAVGNHGLGHDHVYPREELIEVHLSPLQWAEAISSIGIGEGTPCTIHRVDGTRMEEHPREEALARRTAQQFAGELEDLGKFVRRAEAMVDDILAKGGKMKAADRVNLKEIFGKLTRTIADSGPFLMKQTEDALGRMVGEAKAAITDHAHHLQLEGEVPTHPMLEGPREERAFDALGPPNVSPARPEIPDLGPREKDLKPVEQYTLDELAEEINLRLKKIEADQRAERMAKYETQGERDVDADAKPGHFYYAGAHSSGRRIGVTYVSYHGGTMLARDQAVAYLKGLRGGFKGRHYEFFRKEGA